MNVTPKVQPYRNQLAELRRLVSAIPTQADGVKPCEVSRSLAGVKSVLVVHLSLQDGMLYPWMTRHDAPIVRAAAMHHRDAMQAFLERFLAFYRRWQHADDIAEDREGFAIGWSLIQTSMLHRLEAEASNLYRIVETFGEKYAVAS